MKKEIIGSLAKKAGFIWNADDKLWTRKTLAGASLGSAGAMTVLGQIFGISAVAHSSGAMILTGSAGYISGTFIAGTLVWFALPILVVVGLLALFWTKLVQIPKLVKTKVVDGFDWLVRRIYHWRNPK